jgi:hypothetical protein
MSNRPRRSDATFFGMLRDIGVGMANKGQWPAFLLGIVIIIFVIRCPTQDLRGLASDIIGVFKEHAILSYVFNVILIIAWALHSRWQRRQQAGEFDRVGTEKSQWQERAIGGKLSSGKK